MDRSDRVTPDLVPGNGENMIEKRVGFVIRNTRRQLPVITQGYPVIVLLDKAAGYGGAGDNGARTKRRLSNVNSCRANLI